MQLGGGSLVADEEVGLIPRGRRSLVVVQQIRDKIVSGEVAPGSRINERVLAEQLGTSRTPLREAFKILEGEGLVAIRPNAGATVVEITPEDMDASLEVICALEGLAAEKAVERASDAEIAEIETLHELMVVAFNNGQLMDYFHLNQAIHQKIVTAAHNPALARNHANETARIRRFRFAGNRDHARWANAVREHEEILRALKLRQGPLLRELLKSHLAAGWQVARIALSSPRRSEN